MGKAAPDPVALLESHLKKSRRSAYQFARDAGVHPTVIKRALKRERGIGLDVGIRIERASGGDVPVHAWENFSDGLPPQKRRKTA